CGLAGTSLSALHLELEPFSGRCQRFGLFVDQVAERFRGFGKAPAGPLLFQFALDFRPGGLEALHLPRLDARDLDDVEAEIRLDEVADLIRLEPERCVLEGAHHHSAREEAEVAAPGRRAGIAGIFLRELREAPR